MSVVRRETARRWAVVLGGVLALASVPPALAALPVAQPAVQTDARELLERARRSDAVAHDGLVEVYSRLGLPNLPRLDEVTRLLDGTTRARVWWAGPQRWRVATLTASGERDLARTRAGTAAWDYDAGTLVMTLGEAAARLPRTDDLLPPQAVRRLLAATGPADRIERIPPRRVAGRDAAGLRIVPAEPRSSLGRVDVWLDEPTGLPLSVELWSTTSRAPVLTSRFLDVTFATPDPAVTAVPPRPPQGRSWTSTNPDLVAAVDRYARWQLPERLAGMPRVPAPGTLGGLATYGEGLTRFVVLPLPGDVIGEALQRARELSTPLTLPGGEAVPLHRPLLSVVLARGSDRAHAYLLAGTVQPEVLDAAAAALFANPPPRR